MSIFIVNLLKNGSCPKNEPKPHRNAEAIALGELLHLKKIQVKKDGKNIGTTRENLIII